MNQNSQPHKVIVLHVKVNETHADMLKDYALRHDTSITDAVRALIHTGYLVEKHAYEGGEVFIRNSAGDEQYVSFPNIVNVEDLEESLNTTGFSTLRKAWYKLIRLF